MRLLRAQQDKWLFSLGVSFCLTVLVLWPEGLAALRYERPALESGQWWRIVTAHLVHLNTAHLLLNLLGLFLICELLWKRFTLVHGLVLLVFSAIGISTLLWWFHPELAWYAGFSGVLHGLWGGCALSNLLMPVQFAKSGLQPWAGSSSPESDSRFTVHASFAALVLLGLKLGLEGHNNASMEVERLIGGAVIQEAHLYGASTGIVYVLLWRATVSGRARR